MILGLYEIKAFERKSSEAFFEIQKVDAFLFDLIVKMWYIHIWEQIIITKNIIRYEYVSMKELS